MKRHAERVARLSAGGVLLVVGVIGGFVPILQGWLFILAGLSVMAPESRLARRALDWAKRRFDHLRHPRAGSAANRLQRAESRRKERSHE